MTDPLPSARPLVSLGDLTWDVLAKPDTLLLPGGDTTGRLELSGGGSAANLAVWACRLGAPTRFVGKLGRDHFAQLAVAELEDEGVGVEAVYSGTHRTGVILALIDQRGQRAMLSGQGADWELLPQDLPVATLAGAGHLHLTAWSLFRDPPRAAALEAARLAHAGGATLSLDPGSFQMIQQLGREDFLGVMDTIPFSVLLPNADEARALSGEAEPGRAMDWLRRRYPQALVALKLDEAGALVEGPQDERAHVPATRDPLLDATGAGDAFGGAFLACWRRGLGAAEAARCAVQVGGWVVSHFGARPPADDALTERLRPFLPDSEPDPEPAAPPLRAVAP